MLGPTSFLDNIYGFFTSYAIVAYFAPDCKRIDQTGGVRYNKRERTVNRVQAG